jgi:hypothetical protein
MSLILKESCDLPTKAGAKWSALFSTVFAQTIDGRTCWRLGDDSDVRLRKDFSSQEDDGITLGFRFYHSGMSNTNSSGSWCSFWGDGGTVAHIYLRAGASDQSINAYRGGTLIASSAGGVIPDGQWTFIEVQVKIADAGGIVQVKVDKTLVIDFAGDTKNGGADALIDRVQLGAINTGFGGGGDQAHVRDIYLLNEQGARLNDFLGPVIVEARLMDGNGNYSGFTGSDGNQVDNYQLVDDPGADDGDTTYVESTAAADRDSYTVQDLAAITSGDLLSVQVHAIARYATAPLDLATFLRRAATDDDGAAETSTGSYGSRALTIWEQDPIAGGDWTIANFDATEFGVVTS